MIPGDDTLHADARVSIMRLHAETLGYGRAILLGDSNMEGFWWNMVSAGSPPWQINGGIGGAGVDLMYQKIGAILGYTQPKVAVIMLGTNDMSWSRLASMDKTTWLPRYIPIIASIMNAGAVPVILTIPPVEQGKAMGDAMFDQASIDYCNSQLKGWCVSTNKLHIDLDPLMKGSNGFMIPGGTGDGVHFSASMKAQFYNKVQSALGYGWQRVAGQI